MRNLMAFFPGNFSLQNHPEELQSLQSFNPVLPSCSAPQEFHGVNSLLGKRSMSFSGIDMCEEINGDDELSDDCLQIGEKKKRLNFEQVKTLEKNFELGNKLEPERKIHLAKTLGLQPRQIAIWFQNRRARWKTKQLEKDYGVLKKEFETLKADNDALQTHNKKLQEEILALKGGESQEPINLNKETEASCSNKSENSYDINLEISRTSAAMEEPLSIHPHRPIFQSLRPTTMMQFIHNSSRSDLQFPKVDNGVHEDGFCNLLCNVEEQTTTFWPWTDHNHFH